MGMIQKHFLFFPFFQIKLDQDKSRQQNMHNVQLIFVTNQIVLLVHIKMSQQIVNDQTSGSNIVEQNSEHYQQHQPLPQQSQSLLQRPLLMIYPQLQNAYYRSIQILNQLTIQIENSEQNTKQITSQLSLFYQNLSLYPTSQQSQNITLSGTQYTAYNQLSTYCIKIKGTLKFQPNNKQKQSNPEHQQPLPQSRQLTQQQLKAYEQQISKRHKQIIKQQEKQRKRIQRLKLKQKQQKLQLEKKLQQQKNKQRQQLKKHHSEVINKKFTQDKQKRKQQRKFFQQRSKDYKFIVSSSLNNPALHEKMQINFRKRYESTFEQDRKKAKSQRSRFLSNSRVEELNIKDHQDKYLRWRSDSQTVRVAKMEEQNRLVEMYEKQLKRYKHHKAKNNQKDNSDQEQSDQQDPNQQQLTKQYKSYHQLKEKLHKAALQKRKKMQNYWQNFVKQERQPQIDPKKQQELQNLIQTLQKSRKMKKVKNQKGQFVYQQLRVSDPAMKGLQYLQYSRQLGRKRKSLKPKDSLQQSTSINEENQKLTSKIDYLKQLRQSRSSSLNSSKANKNKFAFMDKKDLTFHEKLEKVERETFKLEQMTKLSENQLKYGKFKTSEEILQYKEDIDNNHLEILKMKLMLAANGNF